MYHLHITEHEERREEVGPDPASEGVITGSLAPSPTRPGAKERVAAVIWGGARELVLTLILLFSIFSVGFVIL